MDKRQRLPFDQLSRCQKVNRIFTWIVFGTVFVFTFCWIDENLRQGTPMLIFLCVFGGLVVIQVILWITLYFVFKRKDMTQNDKNVEKALKQIEKEKKESEGI